MKFTTDELTISEQYAVLYWQGQWHIAKVDQITPGAQNLVMRWLSVGFDSFEQAQRACERQAQDAQTTADRLNAGLCACGLPYEDHVTTTGHGDVPLRLTP